MMVVHLKKVPSALVAGIYNDSDGAGPQLGVMPERALKVHPEVYYDFIKVAPYIVISDLYRSGISSLEAMQKKHGVQPPSYSHHNYGAAFDVAITESMHRGGFKTRADLDAFLTENNFPQFWVHAGASAPPPYDKGFETWHHSHLPDGFGGRNTADEAEVWIQKHYGGDLHLTLEETQICLQKMRLYKGAIDAGINPKYFGRQSRAALAAFQRAWMIETTAPKKGVHDFAYGQLDACTMRTLAFAAAEEQLAA